MDLGRTMMQPGLAMLLFSFVAGGGAGALFFGSIRHNVGRLEKEGAYAGAGLVALCRFCFLGAALLLAARQGGAALGATSAGIILAARAAALCNLPVKP